MNKKLNYTEQIEHYLEGKMSGEELETFQGLLKKDPTLKSELLLQQDIINVIKESRKAELKSRLDNINISAYSSGFTGAKIALTGALTAVIGLGIYFYSQDKATETEKIDLTEEQIIIPEAEESLFAQPEVKNNAISAIKKTEENKADEVIAHNTVKETVTVAQKSKKDETLAIVNKTNAPLPIESFEEDGDEKSTELKAPKNKLEALTSTEVTAVEIESKEDNNHNFHYKFFNNKLYLYGDFKNIPYELIELNTVSGKSLYLYYKGSFYYLEPNQMEISPLNQIKDGNLIGELESLRKQE